MFPQCSSEYLRQKLGPNPSLEKLREVRSELESKYPPNRNTNGSNQPPPPIVGSGSATNNKKKGIFNRVFRNKPTTPSAPASSIITPNPASPVGPLVGGNQGRNNGVGLTSGLTTPNSDPTRRVEPEEDAATQRGLENVLKRAAQITRAVSSQGVSGVVGESGADSAPPIVDQAGGCDENVFHSLSPWNNGTMVEGIRVFQCRGDGSSAAFLFSHLDVDVEAVMDARIGFLLNKSAELLAIDKPGG